MNKFEEKKVEMEVFSDIYEDILRKRDGMFQAWRMLDEEQQETRWDSEEKKYLPVWEDDAHTIPHMVNKWGYVDISEEEMDENQKLQLKAITKALAVFEKLI